MLASSASLLPGFRSGCGLMARKGTKRFMHHFTSGSPAWSAGSSRCHSPPASQACAGEHSTKNTIVASSRWFRVERACALAQHCTAPKHQVNWMHGTGGKACASSTGCHVAQMLQACLCKGDVTVGWLSIWCCRTALQHSAYPLTGCSAQHILQNLYVPLR
jgi:hypothetical protein